MADALNESPPLRFDIRQDRNATVVSVSGEIDIETAPDLGDVLAGTLPDTTQLVLDLTGVGFIDSVGLSTLVDIHLKAVGSERQVRLVLGDGATRRPIEISGLDQVFTIHETLQGALDAAG